MADPSGADRIWKMGATGNVVKGIQAKLNALLELKPSLATDGIFGTQTEDAVKQFQEKHGLKVDGIIGPFTFDAMFPKPVWKPPARHVVYLFSQQEVVNRALGCVGAPVHYHLKYPNGGTNPLAPMPCDEQTGGLDCAGFDAWVQGYDRDFLDGMSKTLDAWDGYCNTDSKISEALKEGKLFSVIPLDEAQEGDIIVSPSERDSHGKILKWGHEGTIVFKGNTKRDKLAGLHVVHCSGSNHKKPGNTAKSAIWKTDAQLWGSYFEKYYLLRFNREYAVKRYHELTGYRE
jgi:peptidoglycan hydrolase-like protein with peptidoglycan-binding domain